MTHAPAGHDTGSFRDPAGRVFRVGGRIFRFVAGRAAADYEYVRDRKLLDRWTDRGWIVETWEVNPDSLPDLRPSSAGSAGSPIAAGAPPRYVLEHAVVPFVSYPYEWPFPAVKAAALLHLDLQLDALDHDVQLADASAYNVQFRGTQPVFIDILSFRRYREGDFWIGHRQFCEQFLNPLLLRALVGVPHNAWYRGSLEGIPTAELDALLPLRRKLSLNVLSHVTLPARAHARAGRDAADGRSAPKKSRRLPRSSYRGLLVQLRDWIARLEPRDTGPTVWAEYESRHSYSSAEQARKAAVVAEFVGRTRPAMLWDLGCNTGTFAELALEAGATRVVGFDADQAALEKAFARAHAKDLPLLPLFLDAANPSPDQGWNARERGGLAVRGPADALLALALVHHLAIGRNVPFDELLEWLTGLAPRGLIEFVPKSDPMVQRMLAWREDVFDGYDEPSFTAALARHARIARTEIVSAPGRRLFAYERDPRPR